MTWLPTAEHSITGRFADIAVQAAFVPARAVAGQYDIPLRVRVYIDGAASELHNLHWETSRLPNEDARLATTSERLVFSHYLSSQDWHPVRLRVETDLTVLVAVANPTDVTTTFNPGPVYVAGSWPAPRASLGSIA